MRGTCALFIAGQSVAPESCCLSLMHRFTFIQDRQVFGLEHHWHRKDLKTIVRSENYFMLDTRSHTKWDAGIKSLWMRWILTDTFHQVAATPCSTGNVTSDSGWRHSHFRARWSLCFTPATGGQDFFKLAPRFSIHGDMMMICVAFFFDSCSNTTCIRLATNLAEIVCWICL